MLTTIVYAMHEGLGVIDANGRFLLRNPSAARLLGGVTSPTDRVAGNDYYGLYHPDGRPLGADEVPYRRAFRGEPPEPVDILVRNSGVPEGRILSFTSTLLPVERDGLPCAVMVFHDVTSDRRRRDELASFAGVVAHDLLSPLTTVEGWSEALRDHLAGTDPSADASLDRIDRAAGRMRGLINDLLAYTTARDGNLSPATVDLDALVADIVAGRIDQACGRDAPIPAFDVTGLGRVDADPLLTRQLLDNLIGNAIKYTEPGRVPHIRLGATANGDGLVRVRVDDDGIGIPAGQREAVFGTFHRAHPEAGYTGTGLGLAICKRIVERHGGTIRATDNPDGPGTRMEFTLPAA